MDSKYGRLFTEEDVLSIIQEWSSPQRRRDIINDTRNNSLEEHAKSMLKDFEGTFPVDEELFLLRAKDKRALGAVRYYVDHIGPRANTNLIDSAYKAMRNFEKFRHRHPDLMKEPD